MSDLSRSEPYLAATLPSLLRRIHDRLERVDGVWLFGSFARGQATPGSDIDLAVLGPQAFDPLLIFDLGLELGVIAGRDVDLIDLRAAPVVLKKEVLVGGSLIEQRAPAACERFAAEAMALYVAFRDELALAGVVGRSRA